MRGAPNAKSPDLAHWVILVAGVVYAAGVALLALAVYVDLPGFLDAYGDPQAWWPIAVNMAAGLASFGTWRWVNRRNSRPFAVVLLALGLATVLALALPAYYACPEPGLSSGWNAFTRVVGLVTNNYAVDMFTKPAPGCDTGGVPLALQFARLVQLIVLLVAATSAVTALLRHQLDRIVVRWSPRITLALGVDDESVALLPRLALNARGTLAVMTRDPLASWLGVARSAGWRVLVGEVDSAASWRRLLTRPGGRHALRDLYIFTRPEFVATQQMVEILAAIGSAGSHDPVRVLMRSENRWHAEHLRQQALGLESPAIVDTISKYEVCAQDLLEDARTRHAELVIVTGRSELTMAILETAAQEVNERPFLRDETEFELTIVGPHAASNLAEQHAIAAWYGRPQLSATLDARSDLAAVVADVSRAHPTPALIFTDEPNIEDQRAAAVLATKFPSCLIYVPYADMAGLEEQPMIGGSRAFGASLITERSAVGRWERLARLLHHDYIESFPDPDEPSRRPWADLDPFYRESNLRQVTTLITSALDVGRTWGASPEDATPVSRDQLDEMARREHDSWFHQLRSHGWTFGATRDRRAKRHPDLLPWEELPDASRDKTRRGVVEGLALLETLGYRSSDDPYRTWRSFRRRGEVTAVRRDEPWTWTTSDGAAMRGQAGDWEVTGDDGASRSVDAAIFDQTHEPIGGDRWRRVGEVRGRQARPGEVVHSLEGDETARLGQWVLRGAAGEEWLVSTEHLEAAYDRADDSSAV